MRCPVEVCELRQGVATSTFRAQGRRFQILQGVGKLLEYQLQNPSVLGNGVYNKVFLQIFGMHGINLPSLLDTLRQEGEVVTIGTETGVLESKRCNTIANTASTDKTCSVCSCWQLHAEQPAAPSGPTATRMPI